MVISVKGMDEINQGENTEETRGPKIESQEALTLKGSGRSTEAHKGVRGRMAREKRTRWAECL